MEQNTLNLIERYQLPITVIPEDRKYWFFRTQGGEYYNEFTSQGYIALGFDEFNEPERLFKMKQKEAYEVIGSTYGDKHRPGKVYNQIKKFAIEMKPDDVVIIPGVDTGILHFGIITSPLSIISEHQSANEDVCKYRKRRKVNWIKKIKRDDLDPYLYKMTRPHNAISEATSKYAHYIDRTLYSVFTKGNDAYCYLDVTKEAGIRTFDFFPMGYDMLKLLVEFEEYSGINLQLHNMETKVNMQSKGKIGFKTYVLAAGAIGIMTALVLASGGKVELPTGVKIESNSMLDKLTSFLNEKQKREQKEDLYKKLDSMKVITPEEMKTIDKQIQLIDGEKPKEEEKKEKEEDSGKKEATTEKSVEKKEDNKKAESQDSQHSEPKKEDKNQN